MTKINAITMISIILSVTIKINVVIAADFDRSDCTISNYNGIFAINSQNELLVLENTSDNDENQVYEPTWLIDDVRIVKWNYAIQNDGSLWTWGESDFIEHGQRSDTLVKVMDNVVNVNAGTSNALVLKNDSTLWGVGLNYDGQLGKDSLYEYVQNPVKIMNNVMDMASGYNHNVILKKDGSVWTLGNNGYGQLGLDKNVESSCIPVKIMENVKKVFAGESSGFAIDEQNNLWRWGTNYGNYVGGFLNEVRLFKPTLYVSDVKQVSSQWGFNLILKTDDTLWAYGEVDAEELAWSESGVQFKAPLKICENVNSLSGWGHQSCLALKNDGELFLLKAVAGDKPFEMNKISEDIMTINDTFDLKHINFSDIQHQSTEVQNAINKLSKAGIVIGISDTEYAPDKEITRAETAVLFLRMTGRLNEEFEKNEFIDVTPEKWYYNVAGASVEKGIINGFEDNTFRGEEKVTAMQFVTMASRVLKAEAFEVLDESLSNGILELPEWAKQSVQLAISEGLILENEVALIDQTSIDRGTAALILYRLYNKI